MLEHTLECRLSEILPSDFPIVPLCNMASADKEVALYTHIVHLL